MRLIIDISENDYERFKNNYNKDYVDSMLKVGIIAKGVPLEKIIKEFVNRYPKNYAGELELGGREAHFSLNEILDIIDYYIKEC